MNSTFYQLKQILTLNFISIIALIKMVMDMEMRNAIEIQFEAKPNESSNQRSWIFYSFIDICRSHLLTLDGTETKETVQEHFKEYIYDKQDRCVYSSTVVVKKKQIKLDMKQRGHMDVLYFKC